MRWNIGLVIALCCFGLSASAAEQVWVQEGTVIWKMNTDGHRVTKKDLGSTFGMQPTLLLDDGYEVIWAVGSGKFGVYDLRETEPKAHVLLEKVGRDVQNFQVAILDWEKSIAGSVKELQYGEKALSVAIVGGVVQTRVDQVRLGEDTSGTKRLKWVGDTWIKANENRERKGEGSVLSFSVKPNVELSISYQRCEEAGQCGRSVAFVDAQYSLVLTEAECNDGCYFGCHIRNNRKQMGQPPNMREFKSEAGVPSGSCRDYFIAADGKHFATRTEMCSLTGGAVNCKSAPGTVLGWVNGKVILSP